MNCTRCEGTGFLNAHLIPVEVWDKGFDAVLAWMKGGAEPDAAVCDCCGDGESWHGVPGQHYTIQDPSGPAGPYAYNGGLAECH